MFEVKFQRIGRSHNVPPLRVHGVASLDEVAREVHAYARAYLASRDYDVMVAEDGEGTITAGFHDAGRFTVTAVN